MGGPYLMEGVGSGAEAPGDVGSMSVQVPNGVFDILAGDEAAAVAAAKKYLRHFAGPDGKPAGHADQRVLRHLVPESRVRSYDVRPVIEAIFDSGSVLELRPEFGTGIITALAMLGGRPVAGSATNPRRPSG